jgi:hypothetical protein
MNQPKVCVGISVLTVLSFLFLLNPNSLARQQNENSEQGVEIFNGVQMSGNWFISYRSGYEQIQADDETIPDELIHSSEFVLKRSYFTLKKKLNDVYSVRYTQDLTVDREGSDAGNVETRLKYLYVKAQPNLGIDWLSGGWAEVGMVHRPWLDYEQKINSYRVQDNMAVERARIFNSADIGIVIGGNIGPKMDEEFLKNVDNSMSGKYVSFTLGVYNGGGYSGLEANINKVVAGRISVRPLANTIPEIQLSGYINIGKGNIVESPDFNQILGFIAYSGKNLTLTSQYHTGVGDFRARYIDPLDASRALENTGYSFFGEYIIPKTRFAVWGRFDHFEVDELSNDTQRYIGGVAYRINNNLRLVVNTEGTTIDNDIETVYEANLEISF